MPKLAPHSRVAFARIVSNTACNSPGEREITPSTSEVAVCCSRTAASSRASALTCSRRSASCEWAGPAADGASLRFGLVDFPRCVFPLELIVLRRPPDSP